MCGFKSRIGHQVKNMKQYKVRRVEMTRNDSLEQVLDIESKVGWVLFDIKIDQFNKEFVLVFEMNSDGYEYPES